MQYKTALIFIGVILAGACLRLYGLDFGKPLVVHPDEHLLLEQAMSAGSRNGHPGSFEDPSAMVYLSLVTQGIHYLISDASNPAEFWGKYKFEPYPYHLAVRWLTALFGVLGIAGVWLYGRAWESEGDGLPLVSWGSAGLLAVHFLHVRDSHFATVDIPLATMATLALWLMLREYNRNPTNIRRMAAVALFVGVVCGFKYTAIALAFPLLYVGFANAIRGTRTISFSWMLGCAAMLLVLIFGGLILTTPYAVLDTRHFWSDIGGKWFTMLSHTPLFGGGETYLLGYLQGPWMWGGGGLLAIVSFFGLMLAVFRHEAEDIILLSFAIPYLLLISFMSKMCGKWFLPIVSIQILFAMRLVKEGMDLPILAQSLPPKARMIGGLALAGIIGLSGLTHSLRLDFLLNKPDTRAEGMLRLLGTFQAGDFALTTPFCPPLPNNVQKWTEDSLTHDRKAIANEGIYSPSMISLAELEEQGVNCALISSFYWDSASQPFAKAAYPEIGTYNQLRSDLELQASLIFDILSVKDKISFHPENIYAPTFDLWKWERPGPNLQFYRFDEKEELSE